MGLPYVRKYRLFPAKNKRNNKIVHIHLAIIVHAPR